MRSSACLARQEPGQGALKAQPAQPLVCGARGTSSAFGQHPDGRSPHLLTSVSPLHPMFPPAQGQDTHVPEGVSEGRAFIRGALGSGLSSTCFPSAGRTAQRVRRWEPPDCHPGTRASLGAPQVRAEHGAGALMSPGLWDRPPLLAVSLCLLLETSLFLLSHTCFSCAALSPSRRGSRICWHDRPESAFCSSPLNTSTWTSDICVPPPLPSDTQCYKHALLTP